MEACGPPFVLAVSAGASTTGECSELLLQARGRWSSDIAKIYARMTKRAQLQASALLQKGRGRDLEDIMSSEEPETPSAPPEAVVIMISKQPKDPQSQNCREDTSFSKL